MHERLVIIGAKGHGKVVADIAERSGSINRPLQHCQGLYLCGCGQPAGRTVTVGEKA